ncbi:hypothetical protein CJI57_00775 [Bifidobacteriaceae bacterium WP012]|nr:hypothetical protein CJI57_00775 [Bifidobacteriaceae bacterium WP012]
MSMQQRKRDFRKCTRRALFAFFVAAATVLATFAIAPIAPSNASSETSTKAATETKADTKAETKAVKNAEPTNHLNASTDPVPAADPAPKSSETNPSAIKPAPKQDITNVNKDADKNTNKKAETATGSATDRSSTGSNHNSAEYYNPQYQNTPNIVAGNLSTSANNKSGAPRSKPIRGKKNIKRGLLPVGTKFEIKPDANDKDDASKWAVFEGEQCENSKECTTTKAIPNSGSASKYGVITFRPDRWTKTGKYKVHVVVHYPDGTSTSDDANAGNSKDGNPSPVYAYVNVTRFNPQPGDLKLSISSKDTEDFKYSESENSDLVLMLGQKVEKTTFDSSVHLGVGNINQRMICYEKDSDGNPVAGSYKLGKINGLTLNDVKVWKHASYEQQKKCFDDPDRGCNVKDLLYDDDVYDNYVKTHTDFEPKRVNEHTVGKLTGTVEKTGNFVCKVYALKNSVKDENNQESEDQDKDLINKFDSIVSEKKNNVKEIDDELNSSDLFKSNKGITWEAKTLNITVRKMSYYYQPNYGDGINTLPGQDATSIVPVNKCGVGGDSCNSKLARTHDLPDGTWFEIKQYDGDSKHPVPDWASLKGDQSNAGKDSSAGSGKKYGKITVKMSTWIKTKDYFVPVVAHYPDGSSSEDEDSSNEGKPIYLKVSVNNSPDINDDDLKLRVTTEKASAGGVAGSEGDDYGDVDPDQGITMMRGMRFLNPYIDAWSIRDVDTKISLKVLCTKLNNDGEVDSNATWSSSVNGLRSPEDSKIKQWGHIKTVAELKGCKDNPASCDTSRTLFRRDVEADGWDAFNPFYAVERTDSIIDGAPEETGDYQCVVYALKSDALAKYKDNVAAAGGERNAKNGDSLLSDKDGLEEGKDYTLTAFPIHVVEPFKLPKTGFAGWNMLLGGFATVSTCLMVLAFALDQTKWGRAFMKNFVYQNSARKCSEISARESGEIAAQKSGEVFARKGTEI